MPSPDRLRRLHDANDEMMTSLALDHRIRVAVRAARDLVDADAASVLLPAPDHESLLIAAHVGLSDRYAAEQRIPMDELRASFKAAGQHVVVDLLAGSLGDRELVKRERLATVLSIPLFFREELIGSMSVYTRDPKRVFAAEDIEIAHLLAASTAIAIMNSRLYAQAVAQRELQRHLVDALPEGVLIAWPDGRCEANPAARDMLGVGDVASVAQLRAAIDARDLDTGAPIDLPISLAFQGKQSSAEILVTRADRGDERELSVSAAAVMGPSGEFVAAVVTLHDTTDLRSTAREREQFLSIVAHELRTPLTPLKALAQLVRSRMRRSQTQGTPLDLDSLDRNLAAIERQVDRMNGLVNDLLSVSRAERGSLRMDRVRFDLAELVREVVQRYVDATAEEGRHRFSVEVPPALPAHGDQSRIEQLLMNLVGNAVKYSPTGGQVRVSVTPTDGTAEIAISDQGIGIPADDLPKLGHAFVRGAGRAGTFAGMGVGLYVARVVAEAHSGSLELESEGDGKGTTVRVKLPLPPSAGGGI
ncbi:MAG TPA: ATP-binding protein [Candidatus Limnocylindria bacterium]